MRDRSRAAGRRTAVHVLVAALATMLLLAFGATGTQADQNTRINGWSDQNIASWPQLAHDVGHAVGLPRARFIVNWNAALHQPGPGGCTNDACRGFVDVERWLGAVRDKGMQPLISFSYYGQPLPAPLDYRYAVDQFRARFPDVTEFTAWNEPNHNPGDTPERVARGEDIRNPDAQLAARYWNQLNEACQTRSSTGKTCTALAGDFSDYDLAAAGGSTYTDTYTEAYVARLGPTPSAWAIHAYDAVATGNSTTLNRWVERYADGTSVSITEVGAFYCTPRGVLGDQSQVDSANNLKALMQGAPEEVDDVFYYPLAPANGTTMRCPEVNDVREDDPALIQNGTYRPALRTLFPQLQPPAATTEAAADVGERSATLRGSVQSRRMPTRYRFEYGKTTAYGSSFPVPDGNVGAGSGSVAVSDVVGGLDWGTTYHYRLVAENAFGRAEGADQTFRTRTPKPAFARPAVLTDTTNGRQEIYYFRADGTVARWAFDGRVWTNRSLGTGAPARRNTSPAVIRGASDDQRELYYVGTDGIVHQWFFNGRDWFNRDLGSPGAAAMPDTSPVVVRGPGANQREVYYTGADGQIKQWFYNGSAWFNGPLSLSPGIAAAAGTSPSVTRDPVSGQEELYYVGFDGQIKQWFYNGRGTWFNGPLPSLGDAAAENASPVVVRGPASDQREIYYLGADGQVKQWFANGAGGWSNANLRPEGGAPAAPNGEPFQLQGPGAGQEEIYYSGADGRVMQWFYNGRDTWFNGDLRAPAPPVHPGASPAAVKGVDGQEFVYYLGRDDRLHQWFYNGSGTWFNSPLVESAPTVPFTGPYAVKGPGAGQEEVYAFDDDGTLRQWFFNGTSWNDAPIGIPATAMRGARGTRPFAIAGPGEGQEEIYYVGADGRIHQWFYNGRGTWTNSPLSLTPGMAAAFGTSPYVVRGPGEGQREVYYVGTDGQIHQWFYNGRDTWFNGPLSTSPGAIAAPATSPVVTRDPATGQEELYYVGADGQIKQWFYNGRGTWTNGGFGLPGAAAAAGASPVVLRAPGDNQREVYYVGADGSVKQWFQNGTGRWINGDLGAPGAAVADGTSPVVLRPTGSPDRRELYYAGTDGQIKRWTSDGGGRWSNGGLGVTGPAVTPGTSPFVLQAPGETQREVYYVGLDGRVKQWFYNGVDTWFNTPL